MVAILTKYLAPTNTRGARIKAAANGNSITIGYPYELSGEDVYRSAAQALCDKMQWDYTLHGGAIDKGYAFVMLPKVKS